MATIVAAVASVEEYLNTTYRPDCDYVDGVIEERLVGQKDHGKVQRNLLIWFWRNFQASLSAIPEQRLRIGASRYRVSDVCVVELPEPDEQVFTQPPYILIEVLSPEDSLSKLQQRLDDYLSIGCANIWVIDPASRRCWQAMRQGLIEPVDARLRTADGRIELPVIDLF